MQYEEFITKVESHLQPITFEGAERATIATLSTFSEVVSPEAGKNLGSHLPAELVEKLDYSSPENPEEFSIEELTLEDFCELVAEKEGTGVARDEARNHAIGVMKVVKESYGVGSDLGSNDRSIADSELEKIMDQLPEEFAPLFT